MIIRNFRWDNLAEVVDVINRAQKARGFAEDIQAEAIQYKLERYFEAERDCFVAESQEGKIVGIGTMRFTHPPGTGFGVHDIDPEVSKEYGTKLIQATDARLKEKWSGKLPPNTMIKVKRDIYDFDDEKKSVLKAEGYYQVGNTHNMTMKLEKVIKKSIPPGDIEFRPFNPEQARALYELFQDIFEEERGWSYDDWRDQYHLDETFIDPTWWLVAWKGNEIVGISVCYTDFHEEPQKTGWIDNIGVRVNIRRQGIGKGLLQQSLFNFQQRGLSKAIARPDGSNTFGVVSVLQREGFKIEKTRLWYEKVLSDEEQ